MANTQLRSAFSALRTIPALCALFLGVLAARPLLAAAPAPTAPSTHTLTFANATESRDAQGRVVFVGHITGDIPGILTIAMVVNQSGTVTGGEWALNVSYTQFGAPDPDGDGDPSEVLIQKGVIKGTIVTGGAGIGANGLALSANGLQLKITGATVQYAAVTSGTGSFTGSGLNVPTQSNGTLNLTF